MVLIANPIYDVVFKYLMEDNKVAKLLLSAIIGCEILELTLTPQEIIGEFGQVAKPKKKPKTQDISATEFTNLTVYRLDFAAKILTTEGEKIIIIEIQKAKLMHDIIRFRRYLGKQYSDEKNSYTVIKNGKKISVGIPIISIYFLGEALDNIHGIPVLKINNQVIDLHSGLEIKIKEDFIESLTHQSYIISIPDLSKKRRDELEILLSIFDQSTKSDNKHLLSIDDNLPEKYREVIRRLQKAAAEKGVRETMQVEDDFLSEMADYERQIETQYQTILDTKKQLFEAEKQKEETEKQKEEITQKLLNSEQKLIATVQKCLSKGMNVHEIADLLEISLVEIQNIQNKL